MRGALWLGAIAAGWWSGPLCAQEVSVVLGGVNARYADTVSGSAALLGGRLGYSRGATRADLESSFARFTSGEWAAQLGLQGLYGIALSRRDALGFALGGSFNKLQGGIWSTTAAAGPFLAHSAGSATASLSLTGGGVRTVDLTTLAVGTASLGLRVERGPWRVESFVVGTGADTLRFADGSAAVGWRRSSLSVGLSGGARAGDLATNPWWQLLLDASVAPWATVETSAGWYPKDLTGFTAGRFATLGVRLALLRSPRTPTLTGSGAFRAERLGPSRVRVMLQLDDARSVAIAGEWNDWVPAPMQRDHAGRWVAVVGLRPGVYRCALLVDGARWVVPPGTPKAGDDFGGEVGLLVVPEA